MVYKSLNGLAPDYLRSRFVERSTITGYSLRNTEDKLAVPLPRTNFLKHSFRYSGWVLWNSLPTHLRQNIYLPYTWTNVVPQYWNDKIPCMILFNKHMLA